MTSRFLRLFKPFVNFTFEIKKPEKTPSFKTKVLITLVTLVLYLTMLAVPVYGITTSSQDPFFAIRTILASNKGSLAELGIGPIVTAGMIMQLLVGSQIIKVDFNDPDDRALYTGAQKVMSVLMTLVQAIAYIVGGAYGDPTQISLIVKVIVVTQLVLAGLAIMMMDEMIQKGWGLGSGISLFIATSVSFQIFDGMFSLKDYMGNDGKVYFQGAILAFFQSLYRGTLLTEGISRPGRYPDLVGLFGTVIVFAVVIYFDSARIEIPVQHTKYRMPARYPIKLLYVSNIPVILVSALFANIYFISNLMDQKYAGDPGFMGTVARMLGVWDTDPTSGQKQPVSGLASFTTPPYGPEAVAQDPFRALIYLLLMTVLSTFFAMVWVQTAGMASRDVARQLIQAEMQIPGFRRNPKILERYLDQYIPYAAFIGGFFIGILAALADFIGALGTGTGILLTTGIIKQYYEILAKESLADVSPGMAALLGIQK